MEPWIWPVLLLAVGLALSIMEIFFPSGGLLGFLCAGTIIAAIVMAFRAGPLVGLTILAGAVLGLPLVVAFALQVWPNTPMGKRMLLTTPTAEEVLPDSPRQQYLRGLIGRVGEAKSKMLPSGAVFIDGKTIDAMSEGQAIEVGQRVRVVEVRANRVVVRPTDQEEPGLAAPDPLERPIDTIATDPFEPPAA